LNGFNIPWLVQAYRTRKDMESSSEDAQYLLAVLPSARPERFNVNQAVLAALANGATENLVQGIEWGVRPLFKRIEESAKNEEDLPQEASWLKKLSQEFRKNIWYYTGFVERYYARDDAAVYMMEAPPPERKGDKRRIFAHVLLSDVFSLGNLAWLNALVGEVEFDKETGKSKVILKSNFPYLDQRRLALLGKDEGAYDLVSAGASQGGVAIAGQQTSKQVEKLLADPDIDPNALLKEGTGNPQAGGRSKQGLAVSAEQKEEIKKGLDAMAMVGDESIPFDTHANAQYLTEQAKNQNAQAVLSGRHRLFFSEPFFRLLESLSDDMHLSFAGDTKTGGSVKVEYASLSSPTGKMVLYAKNMFDSNKKFTDGFLANYVNGYEFKIPLAKLINPNTQDLSGPYYTLKAGSKPFVVTASADGGQEQHLLSTALSVDGGQAAVRVVQGTDQSLSAAVWGELIKRKISRLPIL